MAVTANSTAPYAPPSAVMEVINRVRRGLPSPITQDVLLRAGISESLAPRTLQALQILDLIDGEGHATDTLEGLRRSPEPELQKRLTDWLNAAYADVLQFIDPATADDGAVRDAFRNYNPVGQQPRMVTLFVGLYAAAGVRADAAAKTPRPRSPSVLKPPRRVMPTNKLPKTTPPPPSLAMARVGEMPPALAGLLASLPAEGNGWTKEARDKFVATFNAVLDFCFPIITQAQANELEADEQSDV